MATDDTKQIDQSFHLTDMGNADPNWSPYRPSKAEDEFLSSVSESEPATKPADQSDTAGKNSPKGESAVAESADEHRIEFQRITSKELDSTEFNQEYLIENVLVVGQPMIVAGPQKSLKTSMMINLAVSLARGGFFLGKFKCNRSANVAFMSGESGMATIQETARRICEAAGTNLSDLNVIWSPDLPQFARADHRKALEGFLVADEIETLIIDPAYLAMPGDNAGSQSPLVLDVSFRLAGRRRLLLDGGRHRNR